LPRWKSVFNGVVPFLNNSSFSGKTNVAVNQHPKGKPCDGIEFFD